MSNLCPYCGECACCAHPYSPCPKVSIDQLRQDARREVIEEIRKIHLCQFGCTFCKKYLSKEGGE